MSSTTGTLVAELRNKPWGETRHTSGSTPTTYHFTGQREDAGLSGLYFYNARWYEPGVGRFVQADTLVPGAGNPQAFNRYTYALSNPLVYIDPSGHVTMPSCAGIPDCGLLEDDPLEPPPDACEILGLLCKPPADPIIQPENLFEYDVNTLDFEIGPDGLLMATSQNKGGGLKIKVAELLLKVLPPGSAAADWVIRVLCGGDCSDEASNGIKLVQFLDSRAKVEHIMEAKHYWERLVKLTGDLMTDYKAIQPYIQQAINNGTSSQINTTRFGEPVMQYVANINGEVVTVRAVQLVNGIIRVTDAWVNK